MDGGPRQRILEATYACVARWGLSKTTVEDAAREAGLSRATVYRYFPGGRDELIDAVVSWQYLAFFGRLYEEVHGAASLEEVLERGLALRPPAGPRARGAAEGPPDRARRAAAQAHGASPTGRSGSSAASSCPTSTSTDCPTGVEVHEAADFLARMILSYISAPGHWDLADPEQVRHPGPHRAAARGGAARRG